MEICTCNKRAAANAGSRSLCPDQQYLISHQVKLAAFAEGVLGQTAAGLSGSSEIPLQATLPKPTSSSEDINISNLTAVLEAVVATKKQASACIREAFRLGLLPLGQPDAACTAGSAAREALDIAATRALFERVLAVMSRSQALSKQLAVMVIPCATAARGLRQQNRSLSVQAQQASQAATRASTSLRHEQGNAAHLKQQLEVAKVALNMKQRHLAKLQEEQQAATLAQAAQLQKVGQAVNKLMEVVNGQSVQLADKQRLMAVTTDILQALL
eukprot:gene6785-7002_t